MDVKELLKAEFALRHTKLQEEFIEGQPELIGDSEVLHSGPQSPEVESMKTRARDKFERLGAQIADQYSDMIMKESRRILSTMYNDKSIDVEANAAAYEYENGADYMDDSDDLMDIATELSRSFLEGMEQAWFYPIIS